MKSPYLRISVTSACNSNCYFCHLDGNPEKTQELPIEDILLSTKLTKEYNIEKIKLTGGEPLVRDNLVSIISKIKNIYPEVDLSLVTNGILLEDKAKEIKNAGLDRVTVSIHSLGEDNYSKICGVRKLGKVKRGLEKAKEVGLDPVKLNVVVNKYNFSEIESMVDFAYNRDYVLRFLEMISSNKKAKETKISEKKLHERLLKIFDEYKEIKEQGTELCLYTSRDKKARVKKKVENPGEGNYLRLTANSKLKPHLNDEGALDFNNGSPKMNFSLALERAL